MKFTKEFLIDKGGEDVSNVLVKHNRWSVTYERIFGWEGRFYKTRYNVGATENQSECPYEYEPEEIECPEVFPVEKTVTVYEER